MNWNKKENDKHVDTSEVFKHKSLMAAKNRKKMAEVLRNVLICIAVLIVAACIFTYFVGII